METVTIVAEVEMPYEKGGRFRFSVELGSRQRIAGGDFFQCKICFRLGSQNPSELRCGKADAFLVEGANLGFKTAEKSLVVNNLRLCLDLRRSEAEGSEKK
jgi:hypothetical protein